MSVRNPALLKTGKFNSEVYLRRLKKSVGTK